MKLLGVIAQKFLDGHNNLIDIWDVTICVALPVPGRG